MQLESFEDCIEKAEKYEATPIILCLNVYFFGLGIVEIALQNTDTVRPK